MIWHQCPSTTPRRVSEINPGYPRTYVTSLRRTRKLSGELGPVSPVHLNTALTIRVVCVGQRGHGQCNKTGWTPVCTIISKINAQLLGKFLGIGGNAVFLKRPTSKVAADGGSPGRVTFGDTIGLQ